MSPAATTFLFCTSKNAPANAVQVAMAECEKKLIEMGVRPVMTASGDWFAQSFSSCGDWDSWVWETVNSRDYLTREVRFKAFVVWGTQMGRATRNIVTQALAAKRVVLCFVDGNLGEVTGVIENNPQDYQGGWELAFRAIEDAA